MEEHSQSDKPPESKAQSWGLLVLLAGAPVLLVLILLWAKPKPKSWKEQGRVPSSTNSYAVWAAFPYQPISPGPELRAELEKISVVATEWTRNNSQLHELQEMAYDLLAGYNVADYEIFKKFRFPISGGVWNRRWIDSSKPFLQRLFPDRAALLKQGDEAVFKEWFRYTIVSRGYGLHDESVVDPAADKQGFLKMLSTEGSRFYLETTNSVAPPLDLFATSFENQGYATYSPAYTFRPAPQELVASNKSITYAVMKLMLKSTNDRPMPYFCRLYWLPASQKWLPCEFCIPFAQMKTNIIVF